MGDMRSQVDDWEVALDEAVGPVAMDNLQAVRGLFHQLRQAVHYADLDVPKVAEAIGRSFDETTNILAGQVDLTLTDLEILLDAVQARIAFQVESIHQVALSFPSRRQERSHTSTPNVWRSAPVKADSQLTDWVSVDG